jgi:hypothetical protein
METYTGVLKEKREDGVSEWNTKQILFLKTDRDRKPGEETQGKVYLQNDFRIPENLPPQLQKMVNKQKIRILVLPETKFPNVLGRKSVMEAGRWAMEHCLKDGWELTVENVYTMLNNLEMDLAYL